MHSYNETEQDEFDYDEFDDDEFDDEFDEDEYDDDEDEYDDDEEPEVSENNSEPVRISEKPYPVISAEDEILVDDRWEAFDKQTSHTEIKKHVEQFMHEYPHLVENLGLEHNILFELRAKYKIAGESEEFILFLLYVRKEFPGTYIRTAGYYDLDIIAWLIANDRQYEIEEYLGYLKAYPVDYIDELFELVDLLEATNNTAPLISLASATYSQITSSHEVIGGRGILRPLLWELLKKYIHEGFSDKEVASFLTELNERLKPLEFETNHYAIDYWTNELNDMMRPFKSWPAAIPKKKSQMDNKYQAITRNFRRFIHERTGISWISAWYYSALMSDYFSTFMRLKNGKIKKQFDFSKNNIDRILVELSQKITGLTGTKSFSLLEAVYHMEEYLHQCGNINEEEKLIIQKDCTILHGQIYPDLKKDFMEADCFKTFPYLSSTSVNHCYCDM